MGTDQFLGVLSEAGGPQAVADWQALLAAMQPYSKAASALPPLAFRFDPAVAVTALARYGPQLLTTGPAALKLTGPFSKVHLACSG